MRANQIEIKVVTEQAPSPSEWCEVDQRPTLVLGKETNITETDTGLIDSRLFTFVTINDKENELKYRFVADKEVIDFVSWALMQINDIPYSSETGDFMKSSLGSENSSIIPHVVLTLSNGDVKCNHHFKSRKNFIACMDMLRDLNL